MLNKVILIGRIGNELELKKTANSSVLSINLATSESYISEKGDKVEKTEWHRVIVYSKTAENCHKFLKKGSLIYVEGKISTNKWQDKDGNDRENKEIKAEVVRFLDKKE